MAALAVTDRICEPGDIDVTLGGRPDGPLAVTAMPPSLNRGSVTRRRPGSDPQKLRALLELHAVPHPRILDASYAHGRIWQGLPYSPTRLDIRPELDVDVVGSWNDLGKLFPAASFDVVVWDPPHITDAGRGLVGAARWADRYGTRTQDLRAPNVCHLYAPFLEAALAVLVPRTGIVVVKIADQVHDSHQQWQFVELVNAMRVAGLTPCDYDVKIRRGGLDDPKWTRRSHLRKPWSFWVVGRAGRSCSGPGVALLRHCEVCGLPFKVRRQDARTCSSRCRQRAYRQTLRSRQA